VIGVYKSVNGGLVLVTRYTLSNAESAGFDM